MRCLYVSDLLATIHRDGGHRELAVGTREAVLEAQRVVVKLREELSEWQRYAGFCKSCALSGERPLSFEEFRKSL